MSNPNLHTERSQLSAAEKEFENNIRPKEIDEFAASRS
jgi:Holliday junction DNA helicase RuvB